MQIVKEDTFQEIGFKGEGQISWSVIGYRKGETLDLKVKRDKAWSDSKVSWKFDIDCPRWGRDRYDENSKITDYQSCEDIYLAYGEALKVLKTYEGRTEELEAEFQKGEAIREAERVRKAEERQAKIDADKAVGVKLAKMICDNMVKQARTTQQDSKSIEFQTRGDRHKHEMRCVYTYSGLTLFNIGWNRVSRKDAVAKLADAWINSVDTGDIKDNIPDARMAAFMLGGVAK